MSNSVENLPTKGHHQPSAGAPSGGVSGAEALERNLKACNVVLMGVDETVDDGGIRNLFRGGGGLPPLAEKVLETRRLGRLRPATQRYRPVLVRFADSGARDDAFKFSDRLKPYRMEEDLTPSQLAARRDLEDDFMSLLRKGHSPMWRGENIVLRVGQSLRLYTPEPDSAEVSQLDGSAAPPAQELRTAERGSAGASLGAPLEPPSPLSGGIPDLDVSKWGSSTEDCESGASPGSPRPGLWDKLPQELQMAILESPGLSMTDLARAGTTAKVFQTACRARRKVDEAWLGGAAVSMFGEAVVTFVVAWLSRTCGWVPREAWDVTTHSFDLTKGDRLPHPEACQLLGDVVLTAPARGFHDGGSQETAVTWHLHFIWRSRRDAKLFDESGRLLLSIEAPAIGLFASELLMQSHTQSVACLGLLHLASKEAQKSDERWKGVTERWREVWRIWGLGSIVWEGGRRTTCKSRSSPWTSLMGVDDDVQRALACLHVWNDCHLPFDYGLTLRFPGTVMTAKDSWNTRHGVPASDDSGGCDEWWGESEVSMDKQRQNVLAALEPKASRSDL
eukprot:jgi/Botrbrau1/19444/Bobra.0338s0066.1